jgi:hypothetical protein
MTCPICGKAMTYQPKFGCVSCLLKRAADRLRAEL